MIYKLRQVDWTIVIILIMFMGISTLLIHSATYIHPKLSNYEMKNIIFYILGFFILFGFVFFDYRFLLKYALVLYGIGIALLIGVLFTERVNGATSWYNLYFFDFQPAELVKLILIITIAYFLSKRDGELLEMKRDIIPIGICVFIPFVLVLIQPDLGNAIIFLIILLGMLWIGNVKYIHVLIGITLIVAGFFLFLYLYNTYHEPIEKFLDDRDKGHWVERIDTYIDPENASDDEKYQVENSKLAIGSGVLLGEGYLQGEFLHSARIPYAYSDSIFVVVGEEFGFAGASALLLLYFLLVYRIILISIHCTDKNGAYMIIGIASMFVFQIFENIGMLMGIMPLTGITLPFVSYGGSSLMINMVSIGIVMSIKVNQEVIQ